MEEINVFADKRSLKRLVKKYPNAEKQINDEVIKYCKEYSRSSIEYLHEKLGFEAGTKKQFLTCVKDFIILADTRWGNIEIEPQGSPKDEIELIWDDELAEYELPEKEWLVENYIPSKSVGVWTGKRGTFKTFLILHCAYCLANGKDFLGLFKTEKGKVIYLDKENGLYIMQDRTRLVKEGMNIKNAPVGFICFSQVKLDKLTDLRAIEEIIIKEEPKLLVVDTYRRAITFEENDAGSVSKLFVDGLRPLVEKYNVSIVLIHHDRKGESQGDEMDMIRGSSDLANYADFILKNERRGKTLILKQLKMRQAPEMPPQKVIVETNETSHIKFLGQGAYEVETEEERCAKTLKLWIINNQLKSFKTKDARKVAYDKNIGKNNLYNGLNSLEREGIIEKQTRGYYKVIKSDIQIEL